MISAFESSTSCCRPCVWPLACSSQGSYYQFLCWLVPSSKPSWNPGTSGYVTTVLVHVVLHAPWKGSQDFSVCFWGIAYCMSHIAMYCTLSQICESCPAGSDEHLLTSAFLPAVVAMCFANSMYHCTPLAPPDGSRT